MQPGSQVWIPEIGLAIGRERGVYLGRTREWLYWYDQDGHKLPAPEKLVQQERERAQQEQQRAERLAQRLRDLEINPEEI